MIGMGASDTENRAIEAVERALNNPLLDVDIQGAKGALINISGGSDITIKECQEVVDAVSSKLDPNAKIIWGAQIDKTLGDTLRCLIIVTGVQSPQIFGKEKSFKLERKKKEESTLGIEIID